MWGRRREREREKIIFYCLVLTARHSVMDLWVPKNNPISNSVSIFLFGENGIGFGKYGFRNKNGICGCMDMARNVTETVRSRELKPKYLTSLYSQITITHKNTIAHY